MFSAVMSESPQELTDLQQRFVEEYAVDCNATQAAIRAGYSRDTARQMGSENLSKPYIREAVDVRLKSLALLADEAIKLNRDIAVTRMNDFMVVRQMQGYEQREEYVSVLLTHAQHKLMRLQAAAKKLPKRGNPFDGPIADLQLEIIGYEIEIERYGDDVSRLVAGRPIVVEVVDLDLVALAKAKDTGRLKSYKVTKEGIQVEMLDAQAAIRDSLKMAGRFITKVEVKDTTPVDYDQLSDAALEEVLNATRPKSE
jgi:phage terminase small subunit